MRWVIPPDGDNPIQHFRWMGAVAFAVVLWFAGTILAVWLVVGGDTLARVIGVFVVTLLVLSARRGLTSRNGGSG